MRMSRIGCAAQLPLYLPSLATLCLKGRVDEVADRHQEPSSYFRWNSNGKGEKNTRPHDQRGVEEATAIDFETQPVFFWQSWCSFGRYHGYDRRRGNENEADRLSHRRAMAFDQSSVVDLFFDFFASQSPLHLRQWSVAIAVLAVEHRERIAFVGQAMWTVIDCDFHSCHED